MNLKQSDSPVSHHKLPSHTIESIVNTSLLYRYNISTGSKIIYTTVLLVIIGVLASLPFLKTQISIKSTGILQSSAEKFELQVPVNGRIIQLMMKDNQKVQQGDTLLRVDATLPKAQSELIEARLLQLNQSLEDVDAMIKCINQHADHLVVFDLHLHLHTGQYQASWQHYIQESKNSAIAKEKAKRTYKRYETLYHHQVLTAAEFEKYKFELEQAESAFILVSKRYKSQWQLDVNQYRQELRQLHSQQVDLREQKKQYTFRAPVSGSLQNLIGIRVGSNVIAHQKIGEISPDSNLLAFCYIKPSDIGLIHEGQAVRLQIDAFNYNQWGLLSGKVIDISDDILILNNSQPVFKVKCSLAKNYLQLKNGYKGHFKKGMNFTARFTVAERSLYQLLYDKIDNWINPNLIQESYQK